MARHKSRNRAWRRNRRRRVRIAHREPRKSSGAQPQTSRLAGARARTRGRTLSAVEHRPAPVGDRSAVLALHQASWWACSRNGLACHRRRTCSAPAQVFPQSSTLPHPSDAAPHSAPSSRTRLGTHGCGATRLGPPPPHTSVPLHTLQSSVPPHPSGSIPQLAFCASQVVLAHPHLLGAPLPAQVVTGQLVQFRNRASCRTRRRSCRTGRRARDTKRACSRIFCLCHRRRKFRRPSSARIARCRRTRRRSPRSLHQCRHTNAAQHGSSPHGCARRHRRYPFHKLHTRGDRRNRRERCRTRRRARRMFARCTRRERLAAVKGVGIRRNQPGVGIFR